MRPSTRASSTRSSDWDHRLTDCGYANFPALRQRGIELIIPSLRLHTMGKGVGRERAPFPEAECLRTYRIANVRIHVERVRLRGRTACAVRARHADMHARASSDLRR